MNIKAERALGYIICKNDVVDKANVIYKYIMIKGDILRELIEKYALKLSWLKAQIEDPSLRVQLITK